MTPQRGLLSAAVRGVVGGLLGTTVMTLYRIPVFRALPPTAEFWAEYVGPGDAEQYWTQGLALHVLYGGAAGGVFGLLFSRLEFETEGERRLGGIGCGLGYGVALSAFGTRVVFPVLLDEELDPEERLVFHVGHVLYGLTLGTWLPAGERLGDVYE